MNRAPVLTMTALAALAVALVGCGRLGANRDRDEISRLLASSGYTSEDQDRAYGATDSTLQPGGAGDVGDVGQWIPFVRFRRYVPRGGVSRNYDVQIPAYPGYPDTTALVTLTATVTGELRTMFDTTGNPILVWRKPFSDEAVRRVYLTKDGSGWHVRRVTALEFRTLDAPYTLRVDSVRAAATSGEVFVLCDPDSLLAKDDLPTFLPNDTVTVTVWASTTGDSCWAFLHHGRSQWPYRWRSPFLRLITMQFERRWLVGDEAYDRPEVRASAIDVIGWGSLLADTTQPYVSAAWGIPYVVKHTNEQMPGDE
ncbi:MAG: hypothetical protein R6X13_08200 [bacterium]